MRYMIFVLLVCSGCATERFQWKSVDGSTNFAQAYNECQEKSLTDRQVQACLARRGWVWEKGPVN